MTRHVSQLPLNELVCRQWTRELASGERVLARSLVAEARSTQGTPRDPIARVVETRKWTLQWTGKGTVTYCKLK